MVRMTMTRRGKKMTKRKGKTKRARRQRAMPMNRSLENFQFS